MEIYIMCGIPGAGKSTAAKTIKNATYICPDDIREEICGNASDQSRNKQVFEKAYERLSLAILLKQDIIFDATNISRWARHQIIKRCPDYYNITAIVKDTPLPTALMRNSKRSRKVPEAVIKRMSADFEFPEPDEGFTKIVII